MHIYDILWIEDDTEFVDGTLANFKEDRDELGFAVVPWHYTSLEDFSNNSHLELSSLQIKVVCIDYNLPGGINGNQIIEQIRRHEPNRDIEIIFYSAAKNESELKSILEDSLADLNKIYYAHKDTLEDQLLGLLNS